MPTTDWRFSGPLKLFGRRWVRNIREEQAGCTLGTGVLIQTCQLRRLKWLDKWD